MNWRRGIALVAIAALGGPVVEASAQSAPKIAKAPKRLALGGHAVVTVTLTGKVPRRARVTLALREDDAARPTLIGRARKGSSRKLRVRVRAPEQLTEGTWQLLACIGQRCSTPARIRLFSDSAFDRIERAKRLSRTQALIHKLQAMLGDRRLP